MTFSPADDFVVSLKIEKKKWFMYEWNVRLGINVIAGYTSKQGYHSFEKRGGGVEKPY